MQGRTKKIGRPRKYDPDAALDAAAKLLWNEGLSGSSLDDIARETAMNRPSLAAAFGAKRDIYLQAAGRYATEMDGCLRAALADPDLITALRAAYETALTRYRTDGEKLGGCFVICTAPAEVQDPGVRALLVTAIAGIDAVFRDRLARAQADGALTADLAIEPLAGLLGAGLKSLALRARSGADDAALLSYADGIVSVVSALLRK